MRVHQNIKIDGVDIGDNSKRIGSKFYNEGKWDNFIEPLLPEEWSELTFVEIGCNAGLFLRLAKEKGFKNVVGVEKSKNTCRAGVKYRDSLKLDYKIINDSVGEKFDFDKLPVADVTLLANLHYHLTLTDFLLFLDRLRFKTRYCIVVSVNDRRDLHWQPHSDIGNTRGYFKDWNEMKTMENIPGEDHRPRAMWSALFKTELQRTPIKDIYNPRKKINFEPINNLVKQILDGGSVNIEETDYFNMVRRIRTKEWPYKRIIDFVEEKLRLLHDVKDNGQKNPILIRSDNGILDGGHRLTILSGLGHKSVITRITPEK